MRNYLLEQQIFQIVSNYQSSTELVEIVAQVKASNPDSTDKEIVMSIHYLLMDQQLKLMSDRSLKINHQKD